MYIYLHKYMYIVFALRCNTLQHYSTLQHDTYSNESWDEHDSGNVHVYIYFHTHMYVVFALRCNKLRHTATHCNTLQHNVYSSESWDEHD